MGESGIPEHLQVLLHRKRLILIGCFQLIEKLASGRSIAKPWTLARIRGPPLENLVLKGLARALVLWSDPTTF